MSLQFAEQPILNLNALVPFASILQKKQPKLVISFVLSRLDYCNSLLIGTPNSIIQPLQTLQNSAAYLIFRSRRTQHSTPLLYKQSRNSTNGGYNVRNWCSWYPLFDCGMFHSWLFSLSLSLRESDLNFPLKKLP